MQGWDLVEQIILLILPSMGESHGSLVAKQGVTLMLDLVVCNVSITSAHSDLHGVNHKCNENTKNPKECVVEGQVLTPHLLYSVTGFSIDSDAICEKQNCPTELPLPRH